MRQNHLLPPCRMLSLSMWRQSYGQKLLERRTVNGNSRGRCVAAHGHNWLGPFSSICVRHRKHTCRLHNHMLWMLLLPPRYPAGLEEHDFQGLFGYKVFLVIAILMGEGLYMVLKVLWSCKCVALRCHHMVCVCQGYYPCEDFLGNKPYLSASSSAGSYVDSVRLPTRKGT